MFRLGKGVLCIVLVMGVDLNLPPHNIDVIRCKTKLPGFGYVSRSKSKYDDQKETQPEVRRAEKKMIIAVDSCGE